jgi:hypothetical protein
MAVKAYKNSDRLLDQATISYNRLIGSLINIYIITYLCEYLCFCDAALRYNKTLKSQAYMLYLKLLSGEKSQYEYL